jgi:hypothetical protein
LSTISKQNYFSTQNTKKPFQHLVSFSYHIILFFLDIGVTMESETRRRISETMARLSRQVNKGWQKLKQVTRREALTWLIMAVTIPAAFNAGRLTFDLAATERAGVRIRQTALTSPLDQSRVRALELGGVYSPPSVDQLEYLEHLVLHGTSNGHHQNNFKDQKEILTTLSSAKRYLRTGMALEARVADGPVVRATIPAIRVFVASPQSREGISPFAAQLVTDTPDDRGPSVWTAGLQRLLSAFLSDVEAALGKATERALRREIAAIPVLVVTPELAGHLGISQQRGSRTIKSKNGKVPKSQTPAASPYLPTLLDVYTRVRHYKRHQTTVVPNELHHLFPYLRSKVVISAVISSTDAHNNEQNQEAVVMRDLTLQVMTHVRSFVLKNFKNINDKNKEIKTMYSFFKDHSPKFAGEVATVLAYIGKNTNKLGPVNDKEGGGPPIPVLARAIPQLALKPLPMAEDAVKAWRNKYIYANKGVKNTKKKKTLVDAMNEQGLENLFRKATPRERKNFDRAVVPAAALD